MIRLRLELILTFFIILFSTVFSLKHSTSYDSSVYLAALSKNLKKDYYFSSDEDIYSALEYGIQTRDPYFKIFKNEEDFNEEYYNMLNKIAVKFGIRYSVKTGIVSSVLKKSPSWSKLQEGDRIVEVNGETSPALFPEAFKKAAESKTAKLKVERESKIFDVEIEAFLLKAAYVEVEDSILKITIYSFNDETPSLLREGLGKVDISSIREVHFDMTQCPGGKVSSLVDSLSVFVPKNTEILHETKKYTNEHIRYVSNIEPVLNFATLDNNIKIVAFKSSRTASSAEGFIGSLKYLYPRIEFVGEQTYGKWTTIQLVKFLKGGMLISVGKIYLPNGETFEGIGL